MNFDIVKLIDLTSLNEKDTQEAIDLLCRKALKYSVAAVCVYPRFVKQVKKILQGSSIKLATVANFPQGAGSLDAVIESIEESLRDGAQEIDLVFPFYDTEPENFIAACKKTCGDSITLKVILETGGLSPEKIKARCEMALNAGANFLKTSTGKTPVGATTEAATIMLQMIKQSGRQVGFKSSGGVRTIEQAEQYIKLAETIMGPGWVRPETFRLGASQLLEELIST